MIPTKSLLENSVSLSLSQALAAEMFVISLPQTK
jgi:hypothetical protein